MLKKFGKKSRMKLNPEPFPFFSYTIKNGPLRKLLDNNAPDIRAESHIGQFADDFELGRRSFTKKNGGSHQHGQAKNEDRFARGLPHDFTLDPIFLIIGEAYSHVKEPG